MNAAKAKKVSLYDLLIKLGHLPAENRKGGNEVWYCSPFRKENEPSFKIKIDQNIWYDFGAGQGGNVIDFIMRYQNCTFSQALSYLSGSNVQSSVQNTFSTMARLQDELDIYTSKAPLIKSVKPLFKYVLKDYLKGRGINLELTTNYVKELEYMVDGKDYFAVGFKNCSSGWELRSSVFKGCIGKKDISLIQNNYRHIKVFEGFIDFLSFLTLEKSTYLNSDILILNSTAMKGRAVKFLKDKSYEVIETYLDNDNAGISVNVYLRAELPGGNMVSMNDLYSGHNDLNDYLKYCLKSL